jgi:hypothetical protein
MKKSLAHLSPGLLLLFAGLFIAPQLLAQETRDLRPFDGIGVAISADVYYTPGNTHEIRIEGNSKDVADLITEVDDGFLKIKYDDWKIKRSKLTIYITSKELEKISISGSAKFHSKEAISTEEMTLAISGSGSATLPSLEAEELEVRISGSGNAIVEKGEVEEVEVKISGSGKLRAERLECEEFSASISGSGSCKITVKEELEARLSGSGSIYYHGNPRVNSTASGSGKVRSL